MSTQIDPLPAKRPAPVWLVLLLVAIAIGVVLTVMWLARSSGSAIEGAQPEYSFAARTDVPPVAARVDPIPQSTEPAPRLDPRQERQLDLLRARMEAERVRQEEENQRRSAEAAERERERVRQLAETRRKSQILAYSGRSGTASAPAGDGDPNDPSRMNAQIADVFARLNPTHAQGAELAGPGWGNQAFLPRASDTTVETVAATFGGDLTYRINQGKVIAGIMETAVSSALPGMVRALVAEDVYSDDGGALLIPRGSRLVGEYQSAVARGKRRVGILWTRLARPDGVDVALASPGTDALGMAGLAGFYDTHFWERFGAAMLLSLVDVAADEARSSGSDTQVVFRDGRSIADTVLRDSINIQPTIYIDQGAKIHVFVARDLNFQNVVGQGFDLGDGRATTPATAPVR